VWIARALPEGGRLITVEKDAHHAQVAREHFELAQLSDRVEVLHGEASGLFTQLSGKGPFDFLFIDAEKASYPAYLAWALENLSRGGVLAAHNAFLHGDILDRASEDPGVRGMREFNAQLAKHPNLFSTIFPAGDGTAIAVMRG
jgi:caffeoyl-CoA O-methyltransferase